MNEMKFVCRGQDEFKWVYSLEMQPDDIDCTTMDDSEFDAFVASRSAVTPSPKAPKAPTQGRHPKSRTKPDHHGWTERELELLKSNFHKATFKELSVSIGKPVSTIYVKSRLLGLRKESGTGCGDRRSWSQAEDNLLREHYSTCSIDDIAKRLNRSNEAIYSRGNKLALKRVNPSPASQNFGDAWSPKEIEILKQAAPKFNRNEIAKIINRSPEAIKSKLTRMGIEAIQAPDSRNLWTNEQINFLENNLLELSIKDISSALGRSERAISHMRMKLGLQKHKYSAWSAEDTIYLKNNYHTASWQELIGTLCRTYYQIRDKARRLSLERPLRKAREKAKIRLLARGLVPIGFERQHQGFLLRKVSSTGDRKKDWRRVDVIEWEQIHGPVPEGMTLFRVDRRKPRSPENLMLKSLKDHPLTSFTANCSPEMRTILGLKSNISQQMNKLEKLASSS